MRNFLFILLFAWQVLALAAPGSLAQKPLFIGDTVKPNIFFMLDDSGSMSATIAYNASINYRPACGKPNMGSNSANYNTYYKTRMLAVRTIASLLVCDNQNNSRIGFSVLNARSSYSYPVRDMSNATDRNALLAKLTAIPPSGMTPLLPSLTLVGKYFNEAEDGSALGFPDNAANRPYLPADKGGTCQKNFVILLSDGEGNSGSTSVGNADAFPGGPYDFDSQDDNRSNSIADIAQHYYEIDLAPSLANEVPISGDDINPAQHLVTYTITYGMTCAMGWPTSRTANFDWSAAHTNTPCDLKHAAWNGRGQFYETNNAAELLAGMQAIFDDIVKRNGSFGKTSFSSTSLPEGSGKVSAYTGSFNSADWSGDVKKYPLSRSGSTAQIASTPTWSAADKLNALTNPVLNRTIFTFNGTGVPFEWASLSAAQKADLGTEPRLNYLRGDRSQEQKNGGAFRNRTSILGDIIASDTVYVAADRLPKWPVGVAPTSDVALLTAMKSEPATIYVGAGDGMLHGFDDATGNEVVAYVPKGVYDAAPDKGLRALTDPAYTRRAYVDQAPTITTAYVSPKNAWRVVAIGGLGAGGKGVYALDITERANFSQTPANAQKVVLWDKDGSDSADLGHIYGLVTVAPLNEQDGSSPRWAAIFGNGYNSGSGVAKLFIVYFDGTMRTLSTGLGGGNGLSTPVTADLDGNGTVDLVYAGDILGNLWKFDLSKANPGDWTVSKFYSGDPAQPITAQPQLAVNPNINKTPSPAFPNLLVMVGTGEYVSETANTPPAKKQVFMGIWDNGSDSNLSPSNLVKQTLADSAGQRTIPSPQPVAYNTIASGGKQGWYLELPATGERITAQAEVKSGLVYVTSVAPEKGACSTGGKSYRMAVDLATGSEPKVAAFDSNKDGKINDSDKVSGKVVMGVELPGIINAMGVIGTGDGLSLAFANNLDKEQAGDASGKAIAERGVSLDPPGRIFWQEILAD
jgi:type IV pilus assembly protein PilY1